MTGNSLARMADAGRRLVMAAVALFAAVGAVQAQVPIPGYPDTIRAFDAREVAMLPPYCRFTHYFRAAVPGGANPDETDRWRALMGANNFEHIHHYCFALMETNRAVLLARSRESRSFYLNHSLEELDYVIERVSADFVLLPEILTKKGDNLLLLGRGPLAVFQLERAIEIKQDYWPAYAKLADHYKDTGQLAKARETLEAGLKAAPGTNALTRRLADLTTASRKP